MSGKNAATFFDGFEVGDLVTCGSSQTVYRIAAIDTQVDESGALYRMARLESASGGRATAIEETTRLKHARQK